MFGIKKKKKEKKKKKCACNLQVSSCQTCIWFCNATLIFKLFKFKMVKVFLDTLQITLQYRFYKLNHLNSAFGLQAGCYLHWSPMERCAGVKRNTEWF